MANICSTTCPSESFFGWISAVTFKKGKGISFAMRSNDSVPSIFFRYMMTIMEEQLYGFYQFPGLKKYFLKFLVSRNVFKKGDFCHFLASKICDKIWHCFKIFCNFLFQKILACLYCGSSFGGILKCLEQLHIKGQNMRLHFVFLNLKCRDYAGHVQDGGEMGFFF